MEKKAAVEAMMRTQEEAAQAAKKVVSFASPSESGMLQDPSKKRLPVGASVSSANIDYEYFEVGTGQVSCMQVKIVLTDGTVFFLTNTPFTELVLMMGSYVMEAVGSWPREWSKVI